VLASRLKNERLKAWCNSELDGYEAGAEIPPYRVFSASSYGLFVGYGSTIDNQPLALSILKPEHRQIIETVRMDQGVAELQSLIEDKSKGTLARPWNPKMTALYQHKFMNNHYLNRAWCEVPSSKVLGICDTVRNRLLRFAIELDEQIGSAEDPLNEISQKQVEKTVVNIIYGGQNVISSTVQGDVQQAASSGVIQGDFASLSAAMRELGVPSDEIVELQRALEADVTEISQDMGACTKDWLKRAAASVWIGTMSVGGQVLSALIAKYLGIS
jgi:hypothetical protein